MDHETGQDFGPADDPGTPQEEAGADRAGSQTGDPQVDEALAPLAGLADKPVAGHPRVFERVHAKLVEVLGELGSPAG